MKRKLSYDYKSTTNESDYCSSQDIDAINDIQNETILLSKSESNTSSLAGNLVEFAQYNLFSKRSQSPIHNYSPLRSSQKSFSQPFYPGEYNSYTSSTDKYLTNESYLKSNNDSSIDYVNLPPFNLLVNQNCNQYDYRSQACDPFFGFNGPHFQPRIQPNPMLYTNQINSQCQTDFNTIPMYKIQCGQQKSSKFNEQKKKRGRPPKSLKSYNQTYYNSYDYEMCPQYPIDEVSYINYIEYYDLMRRPHIPKAYVDQSDNTDPLIGAAVMSYKQPAIGFEKN